MIAPLRRPPGTRISTRAIDEARRMIAATMLREHDAEKPRGPSIPSWQMGLFVLWTIAVAGSLAWGLHTWWLVSPY